MTNFKALYADIKALYTKHFKPAPKQTFGNIIDGLLESIESIEKAEANVSTLRPQLITLAASIRDGPMLKRIEESAAESRPKPIEEKPIIDKLDYDGCDYDNMFG